MLVYVLFAAIRISSGTATFTYEFKDKAQCENTLKNMIRRMDLQGFCQEVRK